MSLWWGSRFISRHLSSWFYISLDASKILDKIKFWGVPSGDILTKILPFKVQILRGVPSPLRLLASATNSLLYVVRFSRMKIRQSSKGSSHSCAWFILSLVLVWWLRNLTKIGCGPLLHFNFMTNFNVTGNNGEVECLSDFDNSILCAWVQIFRNTMDFKWILPHVMFKVVYGAIERFSFMSLVFKWIVSDV